MPLFSGNRIIDATRPDWVRKLYRAEENRRVEAHALALVAELHPAVPRVHGCGDEPAPWLDLDRLAGTPPDLDDPKVAARVGAALGSLVVRMHRVTRGRASLLPQRDLGSLLKQMASIGRYVPTGPVEAFVRAHEDCIAPPMESRCVLHRDLRAANLLYGGPGGLHLLDFENACGGPPQGDVARLLVFEHPDEPFLGGFVDAYGLDAGTLDEIRRVHAPVFAIEMLAWFSLRPEAEPADGELTRRLVATLETL